MTFLLRATWSFVFLLLLSGCGLTSSWFGDGNVPHQPAGSNPDLAPPPKAAPVIPVQNSIIPPPTSSAQPVGKVKVGLLLPLSGPNSDLGHAMLNAAQQAAYDTGAANFELMPRDTDNSEESGVLAAQDAIANGAQILIGPVFGGQVPGVFRVAGATNIPVLTLSTDTSLAQPGLYVMGFAPEAQAERIAHFAFRRGLWRYGVLVPATAYGTRVAEAFQQAVAKEGGTMVAMDAYDPEKHDLSVAVNDLAEKSAVLDALFLPEGAEDLAQITRLLQNAKIDMNKIRLLGTGLWDAPNPGSKASLAVGGWYAAPDPAVRQSFVTTYKATYGQDPPRLTTLAYDATALAAVLAKRGGRYDEASLTNPNGFAGLDGIFRLKRNGEVERGLAVLEVQPTTMSVIDHAPASFYGSLD